MFYDKFIEWIDSWFGGSLAGYRVSYSIVRPHLVIPEIGRQLKWAWQRVFRGWDDRVCWSIDYWLDDHMPDILRQYKKINHGTPDEDDNDGSKWNTTIDRIISGFEASQKLNNLEFINVDQYKKESKLLETKRKRGMILFVKYYNDLWD